MEDVQWKTNAIADKLRQVCLENQIPFLDLTSRLREVAEQTSHPLYYAGRDTHPAPAGYRLIAEEVARFLGAQGMNSFIGRR
jgi:lysophospholipase L1-like esterase